MPLTRKAAEAGVAHVQKSDPVMRRVIADVGPFTLKTSRDRFGMLVRSIISQQISTAAAVSIRRRLEARVAPHKISPEALVRLSEADLQACGLSPQKRGYLQDLCGKVAAGDVRLDRIGRRSDEEVIEELTQIKGIGRWTAQMFLIFSLGRPDVFPHDDLGVRSALRRLYGLSDLPDKTASHAIAAPWRPYATIASWYCWRSGDLERLRAGKTAATPG